MRLLKSLLITLLMALGCNVVATPFYEPIPPQYYGGDPFKFCTFGWPPDCWAPVNPATGTFVVTDDECFNPYSAAIFVRVCPHAFGA